MGLFDNIKKVGNKVISDVTSEESKEKTKEFLSNVGNKISETAKEVTSEENREKAKEFLSNVGDKISDAASNVKDYVNDAINDGEQPKAEETPAAETPVTEVRSTASGASCRTKLLNILEGEFPQYTVKENVSPTTIGGTGKFMNYSIAVYDGDTPKLFIMIIGKTTTTHREYRWSKEEAAKNNINMINFIEHYPNEVTYIVNRLHKYL